MRRFLQDTFTGSIDQKKKYIIIPKDKVKKTYSYSSQGQKFTNYKINVHDFAKDVDINLLYKLDNKIFNFNQYDIFNSQLIKIKEIKEPTDNNELKQIIDYIKNVTFTPSSKKT